MNYEESDGDGDSSSIVGSASNKKNVNTLNTNGKQRISCSYMSECEYEQSQDDSVLDNSRSSSAPPSRPPTAFENEDRSTPINDVPPERNRSKSYSSSQLTVKLSSPSKHKLSRQNRPVLYKRSFSHNVTAGDYRQPGGAHQSVSHENEPNSSNHVPKSIPSVVSQTSISTLPDGSDSEESLEDDKPPSTGFFRSLTRRQATILSSMAVSDFTCYVCLSLLSPFFPQEARLRGISNTISGWIFGVFALVQVIMSPVAGKILTHVGARFLFIWGLFFAGGCNILFGVLELIPVEDGGFAFTVMCFVIRVFMALGCSSYTTASFAILANEFDEWLTTAFGICETVVGIGMMSGPALGGFLYEAGGFKLPFLVTGGFMVFCVPICHFLLPVELDNPSGEQSSEKPSALILFKNPSVVIICLSVTVGAILWGVLDPLLEPHLEVFDLSAEIIGLLFLLMSGVYAVTSPIWGRIADYVEDSKPMMVIGFITSGVGMFLLGPTPWFGLGDNYNELWLNMVALIVLGISVSLAVVPSFDVIIVLAEEVGLPDNIATYGMIAGIWSSSYALGDFLGPSAGGWLQDGIGFQWTVTYVGITSVATGLLIMVLVIWERTLPCCKKSLLPVTSTSTIKNPVMTSNERTPLLLNNEQLFMESGSFPIESTEYRV